MGGAAGRGTLCSWRLTSGTLAACLADWLAAFACLSDAGYTSRATAHPLTLLTHLYTKPWRCRYCSASSTSLA